MSHIQQLLQGSFIFGEASYFFRVTTSTQQLFFQSSYLFRAATFQRSSFSRTVASLRQLFFRIATTCSERNIYQEALRIVSSLGRLLCRKGYFFLMKELVQNNDIYRIATFLNQVLLDSNNLFTIYTFSRYFFKGGTFFRWRYNTQYYYDIIISLVFHLRVFQSSYFLEKANFSEKQYSALPNLSGERVFWRG